MLADLKCLGVALTITPEGLLGFDGPAEVMTDELITSIRAQREHLLAELRAANYLRPMPGIVCPWCRSDCHMVEIPSGLRCEQCGRDAWRYIGGSSVRCDWSDRQEMVS